MMVYTHGGGISGTPETRAAAATVIAAADGTPIAAFADFGDGVVMQTAKDRTFTDFLRGLGWKSPMPSVATE